MEIWFKDIQDIGNEEFRYLVNTKDYIYLKNTDECCTCLYSWKNAIAFNIKKFYKDNNGEFVACNNQDFVYVPVDVLFSQYVQVDSKIDNYIKELVQYKNRTVEQNLNGILSPIGSILGNGENCDPEQTLVDKSDGTTVPLSEVKCGESFKEHGYN